jgi:hypothetical protein
MAFSAAHEGAGDKCKVLAIEIAPRSLESLAVTTRFA